MNIAAVIPVRNSAGTLRDCLASLQRAGTPMQVIVVDDASSDESASAAREMGATVIHHTEQRGAAAARNTGVRATESEIILFLDADVIVDSGLPARVLQTFEADPGITALFGSYNDSPTGRNLVSQYKNLSHHYVHQHSPLEADTFWAGFGAIRRTAFEEVGGFDEKQYRRSSIEDIELGHRLRQAGHRIVLDPSLQVTHQKKWTLFEMIRSDCLDRAVPWSLLICSEQEMPAQLNLRPAHRISGLLAVASLPAAAALAAFPHPVTAAALLLTIVAVIFINRAFYSFLLRSRGVLFAAAAMALHFAYYIYGTAIFASCWIYHKMNLVLKSIIGGK